MTYRAGEQEHRYIFDHKQMGMSIYHQTRMTQNLQHKISLWGPNSAKILVIHQPYRKEVNEIGEVLYPVAHWLENPLARQNICLQVFSSS